jgi:putative membrane protein
VDDGRSIAITIAQWQNIGAISGNLSIIIIAKPMGNSAITAYLHYLSFMVAFAALVVESQTLKKDLSVAEAWRVLIADAIYGLSATTILITGILRVIYFGKGTEYYLGNPVFYAKFGIFISIGLLSLYPTFSFLSWLKGLRDNQPPNLESSHLQRLSGAIGVELIGFAFIPLLAAMLARGL